MRAINLLLIWMAGVLGSATVGAITNVVNGHVSPLYFENILGWEHVNNIPRAAVAQGIYEGVSTGLIFSTIFAASIGMIARLKCRISQGLRYLGFILITALATWCIGGIIAVGLAFLSPEFYQNTFRGVPDQMDTMLRYAWAGGSIWGVQFGGFAALILWIIVFRVDWQTKTKSNPSARHS